MRHVPQHNTVSNESAFSREKKKSLIATKPFIVIHSHPKVRAHLGTHGNSIKEESPDQNVNNILLTKHSALKREFVHCVAKKLYLKKKQTF